jgi:hypothetical protein
MRDTSPCYRHGVVFYGELNQELCLARSEGSSLGSVETQRSLEDRGEAEIAK